MKRMIKKNTSPDASDRPETVECSGASSQRITSHNFNTAEEFCEWLDSIGDPARCRPWEDFEEDLKRMGLI